MPSLAAVATEVAQAVTAQNDRNVQVVVNNPGPQTSLDLFYTDGERWLADRERNSVTVRHFRD
jgi:hypothetical protein